MGRAEIIAYICTLREMNGSPDMCKNIITNFDPQVAVIRKEEDERTGSKGGSQSDVFQEEGTGAEFFLSKSKTSIHSVTPSSDMTEHPDPWITWQIEAQRIRIEQETARADQERIRREDLERLRLLEDKRLKEKEDKEERRHKEKIEAEERLRLLEEKRLREKEELEQKRLKDKEIKEEKRHKEKMEAEERWRVVEEQRMKEKAIADELFRKDKAEAADRQRAWDAKRELEREEDKKFNDARLLREAEERQERERRDIQRELNNKLMVDENARLDREERQKRYQEDKVDKHLKDSRYEVRLQRANDMLKGRIAELPEDIQGIITFFKMAEVLFANFNIPDDLKN